MLLLACGGSDELTDGPTSERATSEPEGSASSGPTTAIPTASSGPTTAIPALTQTSPEEDREALVAFFVATDGPNWPFNDNWLTDEPTSEWEGVITDENDRVIGLALTGNQLSGEIPPELGNLANLTELYLGGNQLSGEIPPELGNLANLTDLSLGSNQLSGEIPPELGNLANLTDLYLGENQLSGCVPSSLLGRLDMGDSDLGGLEFCP